MPTYVETRYDRFFNANRTVPGLDGSWYNCEETRFMCCDKFIDLALRLLIDSCNPEKAAISYLASTLQLVYAIRMLGMTTSHHIKDLKRICALNIASTAENPMVTQHRSRHKCLVVRIREISKSCQDSVNDTRSDKNHNEKS